MNDTAIIDDEFGDVISVSKHSDSLQVIAQEGEDTAVLSFNLNQALELYNAIGDRLGLGLAVPPSSKWEEVTVDPKGAGHTYRLPVPGGWLYRTVSYDTEFGDSDLIVAQSTTFVPNPEVY